MKKMLLLLFVAAFAKGSQPAPAPYHIMRPLLLATAQGDMQTTLDFLNRNPWAIEHPLIFRFATSADVAELLIMRGASVQGPNPLICGCAQGRSLEIPRLLLQHKASVDVADALGCTALHNQKFQQRADVVGLLLQHRASVTVQNHAGDTPVTTPFVGHASSQQDRDKITAMLEQAAKEQQQDDAKKKRNVDQ